MNDKVEFKELHNLYLRDALKREGYYIVPWYFSIYYNGVEPIRGPIRGLAIMLEWEIY